MARGTGRTGPRLRGDGHDARTRPGSVRNAIGLALIRSDPLHPRIALRLPALSSLPTHMSYEQQHGYGEKSEYRPLPHGWVEQHDST